MGTNCRGYLNLAAEGRFEEGYILSREPNPVAAMCSYVCSAPCERACRRGDIDRPLAIRAMKRFLVEWHEASGIPDVMPQITPRDERVAVVGAGPAGLVGRARARDEGLPGHRLRQPAVRRRDDAHRRAGLPPAARGHRDGRPAGRAPRRHVRLRHDDRQGHHVRAAAAPSTTPSPSRPGRWTRSRSTSRAPSSTGVDYGVDFMKKANLGQPLEVGNDVVVIGGGYTAMDCSRTSLRHGAENVTIAYRRTRSELVVDEEELGETEREGVRMEFLASPIEVLGEDGKVSRRQVHPQPPRRAGCLRSPLAGADRGLRVRRPGPDGHPGRVAGRGPDVPAGRGQLRDQPRPGQGRPRDVRHRTSRACSPAATS